MRVMNIVLIGYRCSGKTRVGKVLAEALGWDMVDTDALIEDQAGWSIETLVAQEGWGRFRDLEKAVIKDVSEKDRLIVATGGGIITNQENVKNLKKKGFLVWLKADPHVLKARMEKEQAMGHIRPSLTGRDSLEEIQDVLNLRNPLYKNAGDMELDTGRLSIQEISDRIIQYLREKAGEYRRLCT